MLLNDSYSTNKFLKRWTISWLRELSDDFVTIDINTAFYCSRAMTLLFSSLKLLAAAPITLAWMTVNYIYTISKISPKLQTIKLINLSKEKWLHLIHFHFVTWTRPVRRILIQCKRQVGLGHSERNNAPYSRGYIVKPIKSAITTKYRRRAAWLLSTTERVTVL